MFDTADIFVLKLVLEPISFFTINTFLSSWFRHETFLRGSLDEHLVVHGLESLGNKILIMMTRRR